MGIPKRIKISDGYYGQKEYYFWEEYETYEEAIYNARKMKITMKVKYFIIESQDSWFLPVPKFVLYLNKKVENGSL